MEHGPHCRKRASENQGLETRWIVLDSSTCTIKTSTSIWAPLPTAERLDLFKTTRAQKKISAPFVSTIFSELLAPPSEPERLFDFAPSKLQLDSSSIPFCISVHLYSSGQSFFLPDLQQGSEDRFQVYLLIQKIPQRFFQAFTEPGPILVRQQPTTYHTFPSSPCILLILSKSQKRRH